MIDLYANIRKRRQELNMSQEELAESLGYKSGKGMISKIEKGEIDLPQSKIIAAAVALKTTPSELMGWGDHVEDDFKTFQADKDYNKKNDIDTKEILTNDISKKELKPEDKDELITQLAKMNISQLQRVSAYVDMLITLKQ